MQRWNRPRDKQQGSLGGSSRPQTPSSHLYNGAIGGHEPPGRDVWAPRATRLCDIRTVAPAREALMERGGSRPVPIGGRPPHECRGSTETLAPQGVQRTICRWCVSFRHGCIQEPGCSRQRPCHSALGSALRLPLWGASRLTPQSPQPRSRHRAWRPSPWPDGLEVGSACGWRPHRRKTGVDTVQGTEGLSQEPLPPSECVP